MLEMFQPKCFIAVLGNIYTDHLDWHGNSFENYKNAKLNITKKSENIVIRDDLYNDLKINSLDKFL
jgi:UDP-N-acetylmuramoylalanine-D-glutamate ligase